MIESDLSSLLSCVFKGHDGMIKEKVPFRMTIRTIILVVVCTLWLNPNYAQTITNNGDTIYIGNGVTMTVNGSFQNLDNGTNSAYIHNEGILQISGDFTKSPSMIYTGNDSLLLNGTSTQTIAGLSYWYLGINSGGTKTLNGNASVTNKLSLTNGILNTSTFTVSLDSQATLIEDSANYVTGNVQMQKYIKKGINYTFGGMGVEIKADSLVPGLTTVTRVTGSHLSGNGYQSVDRYFTIVPTHNGKTGSTIVFHYFDGELNSLTESDLAIYRHRTNGHWEYNGFSSRNAGINTITASADTLGVFTAGSILHPLPVEWLNFTATLKSKNTIILNWQTATEINNDKFEIERSLDGTDFIKIDELKGQGNSSIINSYAYPDNIAGINTTILYYRIKQLDFNGKYTYSEIRKVILSEKPEKMKAWYNSSNEKLEATLYYDRYVQGSLRLIDIQVKLIAEQNIHFEKGELHLQLDMTGLAKGIYTLSIADDDGVEVKRVLKY